MDSLKQLQGCGQSIWPHYIRRDLLTSGEFQRLVQENGVHGVTSTPTIFDKAIAAGSAMSRMNDEGGALDMASRREPPLLELNVNSGLKGER